MNTPIENIFSTIIYIVSRLGVPIFLFLSGFLILNKKFDNESDIKLFYKKNLIPLFISTEIWTVIYVIIYCSLYNREIGIFMLLRYMLFLDTITPNIWYMPMIMGIYIALPFVSIILKKFSMKILKIPFIITCSVCYGVPLLNSILMLLKLNKCQSFIDINFLGGTYGVYIVVGYFIGKGILKNVKNVYLYIIFIASFIINCEMQIIMRYNLLEWRVWYDSVFLLICGTTLFELFTRIKINDKMKQITLYISKISLGIYFIHMILISIQRKYIKILPITKSMQLLLLFIATCTLSIIIIALLSKIKLIKTKLFLIKYNTKE